MIRLLVAGGRTYDNREMVYRTLDIISPRVIIEGGARGADRLARDWATSRGVPYEEYAVDHALDGPWPGAGPNRNGRMLRLSHPTMGLLFPGGSGTADMRRRLKAGGVPYLVVLPSIIPT